MVRAALLPSLVLTSLALAGCAGTGDAPVAADGPPTSSSSTTPTPVDTESLWAGVDVSNDTPTATPTSSLSAAEQRYVAYQRGEHGTASYDDVDEAIAAQGHQACAFYRGADLPPDSFSDDPNEDPPKPASDREIAALFLTDEFDIDQAAVKYLCPNLLDEWAWAKAGISDGNNDVGGKGGIKPGTYRTTDTKVSDCYWERSSSGGNIIANNFVNYASKGVTVTIRSSDGGFTSEGCGSWLPVNRP